MDFSKFKIELIPGSIERINMTDEEYFSDKYKDWISNSKLSLINPEQNGSPKKFKEGIKQSFNSSFDLGSAVHGLVLQPESFILSDCICKPTAKLGLFTEKVFKYRNKGYSIYDAMIMGSEESDYYHNKLSLTRIKNAIKSGLEYYIELIHGVKNPVDGKSTIVLNNKQRETCITCVNSIQEDITIQKLFKTDEFSLNNKEVHYEDAIFASILVTLPEGQEVKLNLKMKADAWTLTDDTLALVDLKTTGKPVKYFKDYEFLNDEGKWAKSPGSFSKYRYYRQMAMYLWLIKEYVNKPGINMEAYMAVVETIPPYKTEVFKVSVADIKRGMIELKELLCRVAYCEIYGYE